MEAQIETLKSTLVDTKPPYVAGTSAIPERAFTLFYGKDETLGRIHLAKASEADLRKLTQACQPATFGVNQQDVLDESYRKAGKMDADDFATKIDIEASGILDIVRSQLLVGHDENKEIQAELYKLNVYGKDSFFKAHKDTPRGESMFGSLVIIFPTVHEGGCLYLRHGGKQWEFDSATAATEEPDLSIGYIAFYSDVEHEVSLVKSGYRVTLTYNLFFSSGARARPILATSPVEAAFTDALRAALDDRTFLPNGGYLGFALSHHYPIKDSLESLRGNLKGVDAVIEKVCGQFSLKTSLKVMYKADDYQHPERLVMLNKVPKIDLYQIEEEMGYFLKEYFGAKEVVSGGEEVVEKEHVEIWWITDEPKVDENPIFKTAFIAYGNEASLDYLYGSCSLVVSIGAAGDRSTI